MPITTIDDLKRRSLSTLGYTGSTDDMYRKYLQGISGSSLQSVNDLEKLVLDGSGNYADRWRTHLNLHGITQKSLDDSLYTYWNSVGASGLAIPYLFRNSEKGVWYDPSDLSTLFQDSTGTTPVTGVGQPIGQIRDKSGNGYHATQVTSTARPVLQQDVNGKYYLKFDGVDDFMVTPSINFSGTDAVTVFAGIRKLSDAAQGMVCEFSTNYNNFDGTFGVQAPATTTIDYRSASRGSFLAAPADVDNASYIAPHTAVLMFEGKISTDKNILSVNGVQVASAIGDQGTGTYGNYPLYIGMRGGTASPFNGHLYSLVVRGALSATVQISASEAYVNSRTGAY